MCLQTAGTSFLVMGNSASSSTLVKTDIQNRNRSYGERIHWVVADDQGCDLVESDYMF